MADETDAAVQDVADAAEEMMQATSPGAEDFGAGGDSNLPQNMDFLMDINLQVSVEVGRSKMSIQDLLQLGQGSVIELAKLAGEPLDIYINDRLIARGEAVIVNEKFGVRITDIISPSDRLESMG